MKNKNPYILILAGGSGTRLWPLSRENIPKQLLNLYGKKSLIEETVSRSLKLTSKERLFIGTSAKLKKAIQKQISWLKNSNFIVEPEGKNTAPIIAYFCALLKKQSKENASIVVLSADHFIEPADKWASVIKQIINRDDKKIYLLGIKPTREETNYGYIETGRTLLENRFFEIDGFKEKPDLKTAKKYIKSKKFLWNSGMFIFNVDVFWEELKKADMKIADCAEKCAKSSKELNQYFPMMPNISVDHAVLEKSKNLAVAAADFSWDDVGSYISFFRVNKADKFETVCYPKPNYKSIDSSKNILYTSQNIKKIALLGVSDLIIVEKDGLLLIANQNEIDKIKDLRNLFDKSDL
ncbi:MAG: sugar phosphate nucleotidyltransferase [Spirochaetia bacterium]|nr:sugar phosphate nucleotidyltransferase [Spirochaetia bacterium]